MYKQKTKETDSSVIEFIENVDNPKSVKMHINYWMFLPRRQVMRQRCGDRASLDSVSIIINMNLVTKAMPLWLAFHPEKQKSVYIFLRVTKKGRIVTGIWKTHFWKRVCVHQ